MDEHKQTRIKISSTVTTQKHLAHPSRVRATEPPPLLVRHVFGSVVGVSLQPLEAAIRKMKQVSHFESFVLQLQQRWSLLPGHWPRRPPHKSPKTRAHLTASDAGQRPHPHQRHHGNKTKRRHRRRGRRRLLCVTRQNAGPVAHTASPLHKHGGSVTRSTHASPFRPLTDRSVPFSPT